MWRPASRPLREVPYTVASKTAKPLAKLLLLAKPLAKALAKPSTKPIAKADHVCNFVLKVLVLATSFSYRF